MQCSAQSKRSRQQCRGHAVKGRTTCRMHGGTIPRGFGLPQTRTGKYSKLLPLRLAQRYEEALANKDLLSLRDDIAAAEARLGALFESLDADGADPMLWKEIQHTWESRCKLTAAETRLLVAQQQMVSIEQLMLYFGVICDAIQKAVTAHAAEPVARAILGDLSREFARISHLEGRRAEA